MPACDASKNAAQCKASESRFLRLRRGIDHPLPYCFAGVEFVLVRNNHMTAFRQAAGYFGKIQSAKSYANRARLYDSVSYYQGLIDEEGAGRHQKSVLMRASNDVHLASHSDHQIVRRIFHLQHDRVALRRWIGRRLN